jgi:hypothetical protein
MMQRLPRWRDGEKVWIQRSKQDDNSAQLDRYREVEVHYKAPAGQGVITPMGGRDGRLSPPSWMGIFACMAGIAGWTKKGASVVEWIAQHIAGVR